MIVSLAFDSAVFPIGEKLTFAGNFRLPLTSIASEHMAGRMKKMTITNMDEAKLAAEIVSVLQPEALRACSREDVICYAVRGDSLKLRTIIFDRSALGRLLKTRDGAVKIEYLKRDLLRSAMTRIEYRYPRIGVGRPKTEEPSQRRAAFR
jgi:hypothetical protein